MTTGTIRIATTKDAAQMVDIYAPFILNSVVSFEEKVPTVDEFAARVTSTLTDMPWLVCEMDGKVAGYAYAGHHRQRGAYRWTKEVSVYVSDRFHRRGVANGLYTSIFALLQLQGIHNVLAGMTVPNPASAGFHQSMGFVPLGTYSAIGFKFGAWHDVAWLEKRLVSTDFKPDDQVFSFPEIMAHSDFEAAMQAGLKLLRT